MKFGINELLNKTPKFLGIFGHALVVASSVAALHTVTNPESVLWNIVQWSTFVGYFLVNMFSEEEVPTPQQGNK